MGTSIGGNPQTGSFSSSYLPKLEATFMRDFVCCGLTFETMHHLVDHYETAHPVEPAAVPVSHNAAPVVPQMPVTTHGLMAPRTGVPQQNTQGMSMQHALGQNQLGRPGGNAGGSGTMGMPGMNMMRSPQAGQGNAGPKLTQQQSALQDEMDAVGEMEMDDAVATMDMDDSSQRTIHHTRQLFGQGGRPQLHLNSTPLPHQALRTSQPPTPAAASFGFQNNPTVSSVNTPTLSTQTHSQQQRQQQQQMGGYGGQQNPVSAASVAGANVMAMPDMSSMMGFNGLDISSLQFDPAFTGADDFGVASGVAGMTINNPAKQLFSLNGASASQQIPKIPQFNLGPAQFGNGKQPEVTPVPGQPPIPIPAALIPPQEQDKPFKCPVIGCEKAYKNTNGLK